LCTARTGPIQRAHGYFGVSGIFSLFIPVEFGQFKKCSQNGKVNIYGDYVFQYQSINRTIKLSKLMRAGSIHPNVERTRMY
jgi:hypothetical protein